MQTGLHMLIPELLCDVNLLARSFNVTSYVHIRVLYPIRQYCKTLATLAVVQNSYLAPPQFSSIILVASCCLHTDLSEIAGL